MNEVRKSAIPRCVKVHESARSRSSFIHGTSIRGKLLRYGQMSPSLAIFFLEDDFRRDDC